jgi:hypothetical protein
MKKVALTLASVLAAAAFAPEASAIPAFARQTGMACSSCHFQKFPVLNGFGRAFKSAGYTMMGAQEKIEGEHLSIPAVLNGAILFKYRFVKDTGLTTPAGDGVTQSAGKAGGQWQMGDEASLFFGGRVTETEHFTIGYLAENNLVAGSIIDTSGATPAAVNMPLLAGLRLPITVDLGAAKAQIVPFTTDGLGVQYGYELSSGGVMRANRWAELRAETSAVQYIHGDNGAAAGTAFVLQNDFGYINFTKYSTSFAPGAGGGWVPSSNFGQNYIRVVATPSIAGWDILAGFGKTSGSSYGNLAGQEIVGNLTFLDLQAQGTIGDMESGIYVQNAKADKVTTVGAAGEYGAGGNKATTIGGEVTVIPHTLTLGAAYRNANNGNASNNADNALTLTAVYDLVQNVALHVNYAKYSGSAYSAPGSKTGRFLGMLEAAW